MTTTTVRRETSAPIAFYYAGLALLLATAATMADPRAAADWIADSLLPSVAARNSEALPPTPVPAQVAAVISPEAANQPLAAPPPPAAAPQPPKRQPKPETVLLASAAAAGSDTSWHKSSWPPPAQPLPSKGIVPFGTNAVNSTQTATFQQLVNGYTGTQDTYLDESAPTTTRGALDTWRWDTEDPAPSREFGLIRFDNIFGVAAGQIPAGATITSATLTLVVFNAGTAPAGTINDAAVDWSQAATTWNNFGSAAGVQTGDFVASPTYAAPLLISTASIDVTASVQAWFTAARPNYGWVVSPNNNDGVQVRSAESATVAEHPLLTVLYTPPGLCTADIDCDDSNPCTDDSCDLGTGSCSHANNTASCDDVDLCTIGDVCAAGQCTGTSVTCPGGQSCNPDSGGCVTGEVLVRQPYLQLATPTSMTIVWRSLTASASQVHYGTTQGTLNQTATNAAVTTNHIVTITGLSPATRYYYDVGSTTAVQAGGSANHFFETSPTANDTTAFRVWALGDSGDGGSNQLAVRNAMLAYTSSNPPDLMIHLGDIAYSSGTDSELTNKHFAVYKDILRNTPSWPTLGNHEGLSTTSGAPNSTGPFYDSFVLPTNAEAGGVASGTEAYYSFDRGNAHFIVLNSFQVSRLVSGPMATWLQADLAATDKQWVIAFWHHPPYSKGTHNSDAETELIDMRQNLLPILETGGVDLVLTGHSHNYERSYLIDGTYTTPTPSFSTLQGQGHIMSSGNGKLAGTGAYLKNSGQTPHEGAVYVVAGHGGADELSSGALNHPVMYFSESARGSCILDIGSTTLTLTNVRSTGVVSDNFTIEKGTLASSTTVSFQQGPGYSGSVDTFIDSALGSQASVTPIVIDGSPVEQALLRFDGIFGSGPGQIPSGSTVSSATLTLWVGANTSDESTDTVSFHRLLHTWTDTSVWAAYGASPWNATAGIQADDVDALAATDATATMTTVATSYTVNVTPSLQAWAANPSSNFGWVILPPAAGTNGLRLESTESTTASSARRPVLSVTFTPPTANCTLDAECNDNNPCNGTETCVATVCQPGTALNCDDGLVCTTDSCVPASGCAHANNTASCSDNNACTTGDACSAGVCVAGGATNCDDSNVCTTDSCNTSTGCVHAPMSCPAGQSCNPSNGQCQAVPGLPIAVGAAWQYFKGTVGPPAAWAGIAFDDTSWLSGAGGFGYGSDCTVQRGTTLSDMNGLYQSIYTRKVFSVTNPAAITGLTLSLDYDDGAVAYLNGTEIARTSNMVGLGTPPPFNASPASKECSTCDGTCVPAETFSVSPSLLAAGVNVLAVQGHNQALSGSSDFTLIATLTATLACVTNADCTDGNLCTTDTCNTGNGTCSFPAVTCSAGQACNPANGVCESAPAPPNLPTNPSPADGATGVAENPQLCVDVSDPNGGTLTVTFKGRQGGGGSGTPFTIIALPDTQFYSQTHTAIGLGQMEWIRDNRLARNIVAVTELGDCVNNAEQAYQWTNANATHLILENPATTGLADGIPYGVAVGNHDQDPINQPRTGTDENVTTAAYNATFPKSRFAARAYHGGNYPLPGFADSMDNHYELFSASGMDFIVFHLEWDVNSQDNGPCSWPTDGTPPTGTLNTCQNVLSWVRNLLATTYSNRRAIITTHFMGTPGSGGAGTMTLSSQGTAIVNMAKGLPNVFLTLGGHLDQANYRTTLANDGHPIYTLVSDYQTRAPGGGNGWLRIMTFDPTADTIHVETYSPTYARFINKPLPAHSDNIQIGGAEMNELTLAYNMDAGLPFQTIGTNTGVASGSQTCMSWPGRATNQVYDWKVEVSDGTTTVDPIWSFTTLSCTVNADCDDSDACTTDTCQTGVCNHAAVPLCCNTAEQCDDSNVCTTDSCNAGHTCDHVNNTATCSDSNFCTTNDTCAGGNCVGGAALNCDDSNSCTNDSCVPATGCAHANNTASCNDSNACTTPDVCSGGACGGTYAATPGCCTTNANCNDGNAGTTDTCSGGNCSNVANTSCTTVAECDDANACTTDTCPVPNGFGVTLDGNDYVTMGNVAGLAASQFTIELWFNRNTNPGTAASSGTGGITLVPLMAKGAGESESATFNANYILGLQETSAGSGVWRLAADFEEGTGGTGPLGLNHPVSATTAVTAGVWHHAAATYDGATWKLYLDGNLDATLAVNQPAASDSVQHFGLGSMLNSTGAQTGFFAGKIDEARMWNVVRTQAEIQASMSQQPTSGTGLVGRWGFAEGSGTLAADSVAPLQNGTLSGTAPLPTWTTDVPFSGNGTCQHVAIPNCTPCTTAAQCDDSDGCTSDTCPAGACVHTAVTCNDSNACTTDACTGGSCVFTPLNCSDGDQCTSDTCSAGVCQHTPSPGAVCNDGNPATCNDTCTTGSPVTSVVGTLTCTENQALTWNGSTAFINVEKSWTHSYTPISAPIISASLSIEIGDADSGPLSLVSGSTSLGTITGGDNGGPGSFLCQSPGFTTTVLTIPSTLYSDLADGTFQVSTTGCTPTCAGAPAGVGTYALSHATLQIQTGTCQGTTVGCCTVNADCDDGNACTTDTCTVGQCSHTNTNEGGACSDGNACTQTDTCQAGVCTGANPVVCLASDQCHTAGTCNPADGTCSNPAKANGTSCADADLCNGAETCQAGVCAAGTAVTCTASDQCHDIGVCAPGTGICSNPPKANGSGCNDGNACTQADTCQAGVCTGANPVVCLASDQCHDVGTCNTSTGLCSNPAKANGTGCNDGNSCTQTDTCQSGTCTGSSPVVCTALDQCHDVGVCAPATGTCSNPAKTDGTACNDANICTSGDACSSGSCVGSPIANCCTTPAQCDDSNVCTADSCSTSNVAAVELDGTNDYIDLGNDGNNANVNYLTNFGTSSFTIEGWFRADTVAADNISIFRMGSQNAFPQVVVQLKSTGPRLAGSIETSTTGDQIDTASSPTVTLNQWHHFALVVVRDLVTPANQAMKLYYDGVLAESTPAPLWSNRAINDTISGGGIRDSVWLGAVRTANGGVASAPFFDGRLDEIRIWDHARTVQQITDNMSAQIVSATGLMHRWGMIEGTGTTIADSVGTNTGTLTNGPTWRTSAVDIPALGNNQCVHTPVTNGTTCDDGNLCTTSDACTSGVCGGTAINCDDGNACTTDSCSGGTCSHATLPNGTTCNDGSACTTGDTCTGGACVGTTLNCDDSNGCTNDACNPATGCTHVNNTAPCASDGNPCTDDVCGGGSCTHPNNNANACSDGIACTGDACVNGTCQSWYAPTAGCCSSNANCNDGVAGTTDTCVGPPNGTCTNVVPGSCTTAAQCNDLNGCTTDACVGAVGGSALNFDGVDDNVTMNIASGLGAAAFTLEGWIKKDGASWGVANATTGTGGLKNVVSLITKGRSEEDQTTKDCNYFFGITAGGRLVADFEQKTAGPGAWLAGLNHPICGTPASAITDNNWHHVAVTYDKTAGKGWRLYLDGAEVTAANGLPATCGTNESDCGVTTDAAACVQNPGVDPRDDSIQHFALGAAFNSTGLPSSPVAEGYFGGEMDEVRVWSRSLSAAEILAGKNQEFTSGTGLLGRWGLNENTGTTASDSATSPTTENGTLRNAGGTAANGPAWIADSPFPAVPGTCTNTAIANCSPCTADYQCSDSNQCTADSCNTTNDAAISFPSRANTDHMDFAVGGGSNASPDYVNWFGTSSFTVEMWVYTDGTSSANASVFRVGRSGDFPLIGLQITGLQLSVSVEASQPTSTVDDQVNATASSALLANTWTHVAIVVDRSSNQLRILLNGGTPVTSAASVWSTSPIGSADTSVLGIARDAAGAVTLPFVGRVDELRIWNFARTQAQIAADMGRELESATGLVHRWAFNAGTGTTAVDSIGGITGTLTGVTTWATTPLPFAGADTCVHTNLTNGSACSDGNACTVSDSCQSGTCASGSPATAGTACGSSSDTACDNPDTCNGSGSCVANTETNGFACDDGNPSTSNDVCTNGVCAGTSDPCAGVTCTALDQCHVAGVCTAGVCSNPAAGNGTSCSDGNACTTGDSCQSGSCVSGTPVTCTDDGNVCNGPESCNPTNGQCVSGPAATSGTTCNDGNACTQTDACNGSGLCVGSNPVVCTASDQCHVAGVCTAGVCSNPAAGNGTSCSDSNACTTGDSCQSGSCVPGTPVSCTDDGNVCNGPESCNPTNGQCVSGPAATSGTTCNDGNACTQTDACNGSGLCVGSNPVVCTASDQCHVAGVCTAGVCSNPAAGNGTSCSDSNACTTGDSCQSGSCVPGTPVSCTDDGNVCNGPESCNPTNGQCVSGPAATSGTTCNDGNACTQTDACNGSGLCVGSNPVVCTALDQCHVAGVCTAGVCSNPAAGNGTSCSDGNACTTIDTCQSGACIGTTPVVCNDNNSCTDDTCNTSNASCIFLANNGNACTDGNPCTTDTCSAGTCVHAASGACGISGTVYYYRDSASGGTEPSTKPVRAVGIDGTQDALADSTTDGAGAYALVGQSGNVAVTTVPKYGNPRVSDHNGAITSLDASTIARASVGLITLSANQQVAGDVTGAGGLSALDASEVARFAVGAVNHFTVSASGSDWKFLRCDTYPGCGAPVYNFTPISQGETGKNFYAVLYGDVTGNWQPSAGFDAMSTSAGDTSPEEQLAMAADLKFAAQLAQQPTILETQRAAGVTAELSLNGWATPLRAGERRQLTVDLRNADGILGLDLSLKYDLSRIRIVGVEVAGIGSGFSLAQAGLVGVHKVAAFGVVPLSGSGTVLTVTVEALKNTGNKSPLQLSGKANEGGIPIRMRQQKVQGPAMSR